MGDSKKVEIKDRVTSVAQEAVKEYDAPPTPTKKETGFKLVLQGKTVATYEDFGAAIQGYKEKVPYDTVDSYVLSAIDGVKYVFKGNCVVER